MTELCWMFQLHSNPYNTLDRTKQENTAFFCILCHYFAPIHKPLRGLGWGLDPVRHSEEFLRIGLWFLRTSGFRDFEQNVAHHDSFYRKSSSCWVPSSPDLCNKEGQFSPYFFSSEGNSKQAQHYPLVCETGRCGDLRAFTTKTAGRRLEKVRVNKRSCSCRRSTR